MNDQPAIPRHILRLNDVSGRKAHHFDLQPDLAGRTALGSALGIIALKKLRFTGTLTPIGRHDWRLEAKLGASVVQECVVTFAPVPARIDEDVIRNYLADFTEDLSGEVEMPEDDTAEPLPKSLDLAEVMAEALSLALPAYPRAPDVAPVDIDTDDAPEAAEQRRPFAGLADLRDKLTKKDEGSH
ncbi:YceD family protein [Ketogulonicigenium vulgare]|uniref:50S ribosomal protein L34 n=1 Tax=Ketogulonicigenium vulgare (strain WSH-001) TaxID=759362 RepID=F9Y5G3_KETVW|nr:DUF177 domain-containing protein [Ketogulonicigenium vulgare]ADO42520.1 conserved hypothetical protein [Ketogulonicigenium vulgare Y25]AEM40716.1 50S ribosomal protein L34 [Ketogulonicigenium vulgare WSH-001]ALJ80886.1 hypothetical protein KVH_06665 [Ketogulonicigenium vulgare]ANW33658.1 hypothetical protein KvSKV_06635 [Ketogulonicigenium vulgare]AOZ54433.1 50S ribosomal protein L34 [Ketogulonicigenium vulgare]